MQNFYYVHALEKKLLSFLLVLKSKGIAYSPLWLEALDIYG